MTERARYWSDEVAAWSRSGLSQAEFCRRRGIKVGTFTWWKRQFERRQAGDVRKRRGRPPKVPGSFDGFSGSSGLRAGLRGKPAGGRFVEVRLTSANSPRQARSLGLSKTAEPTGTPSRFAYEIALACGRSIRVPSQFDPQTLSQLIMVVESC
mgnify:CR=1 FL=1